LIFKNPLIGKESPMETFVKLFLSQCTCRQQRRAVRSVGMISILFISILLLMPSGILLGGVTGKIAGIIKDAASGEPLAGANVVVVAQIIDGREVELSTPLGASTDTDGQYFILNIRPGLYILEASYIGYQTQLRREVRIEVDRTARQNFELREATLQSETIVVSAERSPMVVKDQTSASAKISGDEIKALPVENFKDVIRLTAGVTTGLGGDIHIRGGRASEIQYYIDGMAVSNPLNNQMAVQVENNAIQELEVISGTFNAEYGQAMSGIVNIVTREGSDQFMGSFSTYFGDFVSNRTRVFNNIDDLDFTAQKYFEGFISGPITKKIRFFVSGKVQDQQNWLYGRRVFLPQDSSRITSANPREYYIESSGDSAAVAMNPYRNYSGQFKISWNMLPTVKLSYNFIGNQSEGKSFANYYKLNPEYLPNIYSWGVNHLLRMDHTLSKRTFYSLNLAYIENNQQRYVYEDPFDERYRYTYQRGIYQPVFVLSTGGVDPSHLRQNSRTMAAKLAVMMQVNHSNLIKVGGEIRLHKLDYRYFQVDVNPILYGDYQPRIQPVTSFLHNRYSREPMEASLYIQDKIEIQDLIVNAGLRFDYFYANSTIPRDLRDPANKLFPREDAYKKVKPKTQLSPRLGMAFPITEQGVIHAAYGRFFQIPEFSRLFENPEFEVGGSYNSFIGNADLEAQSTDMYEIGLQQQLSSFMAVDVTAFYRDVRNLLGSEIWITYQRDVIYGRYVNRDHGSVQGMTISAKLRLPETGITSGVDYTYQTAKGIASDPKQLFFDAGGRNESVILLIPLNWDLRHTANAYVNYAGKSWGGSIIGRLNSGYPFTPLDPTTQRNSPIIELRNEGRYQGEFFFDLRAYKRFSWAGYGLELFLRVDNLLDTYRKDLLPQVDPRDEISQSQKEWDRINTRYEYDLNPAVQPVPREVKIGLKIDF